MARRHGENDIDDAWVDRLEQKESAKQHDSQLIIGSLPGLRAKASLGEIPQSQSAMKGLNAGLVGFKT